MPKRAGSACKACTVPLASGVRLGFSSLPLTVRLGIEEIVGSQVVQADTQSGGFSPGSADRVRTRDGRRAFVKAVGAAQNDTTIALYRREAAVVPALPAVVPAPSLLGVFDDGEWVALVFDDVDGRHPRTPWLSHEIDAAMAAVGKVASATSLDQSLPDAAVELADDLLGWRRIQDDPPQVLDGWTRENLDELCSLAEHATLALRGERLVHTDIRADNMLIRGDGTVTIVDWPWASRGAAWLDALLLMVNVNLYGGQDVDRLSARLAASSDDITAVLAGLAGYFPDASRRPAPKGLPTVRRFQADQARTTLRWLKTRMS